MSTSNIRYYFYIELADGQERRYGLPRYAFRARHGSDEYVHDQDLNVEHDVLLAPSRGDREVLAERLFTPWVLEDAKHEVEGVLAILRPQCDFVVHPVPVDLSKLGEVIGLYRQGDQVVRLLPHVTSCECPADDAVARFGWLSERPDAVRKSVDHFFYRREHQTERTPGELLYAVLDESQGYRDVALTICADHRVGQRAARYPFYEPAYWEVGDDMCEQVWVAGSLLTHEEADTIERELQRYADLRLDGRNTKTPVWRHCGTYPFSRLPFDSRRAWYKSADTEPVPYLAYFDLTLYVLVTANRRQFKV